jgi:hypothetical protein
LRSHPIAYNTFELAARAKEQDLGITSPEEVLASQESFQFLFNRILQAVNFNMPQDEKEELINSFLGQWIVTLKEMPFETLCHEVFFTNTVIRRKFIDEWRGQYKQRTYPSDGFEYLDAETINSDGRKVSTLELLEGKYESLQTQPEEIALAITPEQLLQLQQLLGKTGLNILEYRYRHPEMIGQHGEKKIIAEALGIAESTVGEYIGRQKRDGTKHVGILERKASAIQQILA